MRNMMPRCIDVLISQASRRSRSATVVVFLPLAERGRELAYEAAARPFPYETSLVSTGQLMLKSHNGNASS